MADAQHEQGASQNEKPESENSQKHPLPSPRPSSSASQRPKRVSFSSSTASEASATPRRHHSRSNDSGRSSLKEHLVSDQAYRNWIDDLPLPTPVHQLRHTVLSRAVNFLDNKLGGSKSRETLLVLAKEGLEAELRSVEKVVKHRKSRQKSKHRSAIHQRGELSPLSEGEEHALMCGGRGESRSDNDSTGTKSTDQLLIRDIDRSKGLARRHSTMSSDAPLLPRLIGFGLQAKNPRGSPPKKSYSRGPRSSKPRDASSEHSRSGTPESSSSKVSQAAAPENASPRRHDSTKAPHNINIRKAPSSPRPGSKSRSVSEPKSPSARAPSRSMTAPTRSSMDDEPPRFSIVKGLRQYVQEIVRWELGRQVDKVDPSDRAARSKRNADPGSSGGTHEDTGSDTSVPEEHHTPTQSRVGSSRALVPVKQGDTPRGTRSRGNGPIHESILGSGRFSAISNRDSKRLSSHSDVAARRRHRGENDSQAPVHVGTEEEVSERRTTSSKQPSTGRATVASRSAPSSRLGGENDQPGASTERNWTSQGFQGV